MTLDDAIKHCDEVSEEQLMRAGKCTGDDSLCDKYSNCMKCAEEHRQLADWLRELKYYKSMNREDYYRIYSDKDFQFGYDIYPSLDDAKTYSNDGEFVVHVVELKELVEKTII